jgi:hypothetical protein
MDEFPTVTALAELPLDHLSSLSDTRGVFEHAELSAARREHGYCLDDVARALVVAIREEDRSPLAPDLIETCLRFTEAAIRPDGRAHNRLDEFGAWTDEPGLGDWWGRALLALGFATAHSSSSDVRRRARVAFDRAAQLRSPHLRAMVSAAIGAADVLSADPGSPLARRLLIEGVAAIPESADAAWPWPEARLRYGNATIPEALIAAGASLRDPRLTERGLGALRFLVDVETRSGHLSVTGVGGRSPGEDGPQFDQQPIEVAAIADAAARAHRLGHGEHWAEAVRMSWSWFLGDNDAGVAMVDPETGAGFDGLHAWGRNQNRGAESTLAALSTFQQFRAVTTGSTP